MEFYFQLSNSLRRNYVETPLAMCSEMKEKLHSAPSGPHSCLTVYLQSSVYKDHFKAIWLLWQLSSVVPLQSPLKPGFPLKSHRKGRLEPLVGEQVSPAPLGHPCFCIFTFTRSATSNALLCVCLPTPLTIWTKDSVL